MKKTSMTDILGMSLAWGSPDLSAQWDSASVEGCSHCQHTSARAVPVSHDSHTTTHNNYGRVSHDSHTTTTTDLSYGRVSHDY